MLGPLMDKSPSGYGEEQTVSSRGASLYAVATYHAWGSSRLEGPGAQEYLRALLPLDLCSGLLGLL